MMLKMIAAFASGSISAVVVAMAVAVAVART